MGEILESNRLLIELAVNSGRKRKSQQTGYLHHCYNLVEQEPHLPIPLIENFLYVLALLRTRMIENITEAKTLLEGLLNFQNKIKNEAEGNFPIYLHDFPRCKDYFTGTHIACVIIWILKQFHLVIGTDLKKKLEVALNLSVKHALRVGAEKNVPYVINVRIAAVTFATGQLLSDKQLIEQGMMMLDALRKSPEETSWYCPSSLGSIVASLLMVYPRLSDSPWTFLWDHLQSTWHHHTGTFVGPSLKEWQQAEEPQVTLYDFFCGYFSGNFSTRALKESLVHLEAALIPFNDDRFKALSYPLIAEGKIQGAKWFVYHGEKFAYSFIEQGVIEIHQSNEKGFHPFRLLWGDIHRVHTVVCQGSLARSITFNSTEMFFDFEGLIEVEDREKNREILFFIDAHNEMEFFVSNQKASTFLLDEEVYIKSQSVNISMKFELDEGEGRFLGHRTLGNRPAQISAKGAMRFEAYDWQIFLRTINRSNKCRVKVSLNVIER